MVAATGAPDTCVSYYGSAVPDALSVAGQVRCPILFHFGGADDYIPEAKRQAVETAFAGRPAEFHVHPGAGHAFDNWNSSLFYNQRAASESWPQTVEFLRRTLPA